MNSDQCVWLTYPAVDDVSLPHELQESRVVVELRLARGCGFVQIYQFLLHTRDTLVDALRVVVALGGRCLIVQLVIGQFI